MCEHQQAIAELSLPKIIKHVVAFVGKNIWSLLLLATIPFFFYMVMEHFSFGVDIEKDPLNTVIRVLFESFIGILFYFEVMRVYATQAKRVRFKDIVKWNRQKTRFTFCSIKITLVMILFFLLASISIGFIFLFIGVPLILLTVVVSPSATGIVIVQIIVVAIFSIVVFCTSAFTKYLYYRLSVCLPAIFAGKKIPLRKTFSMTKGVNKKIFFIVLCLWSPFVVLIVGSSFLPHGSKDLASIIVSIFTSAFVCLLCTIDAIVISYIYKKLQ